MLQFSKISTKAVYATAPFYTIFLVGAKVKIIFDSAMTYRLKKQESLFEQGLTVIANILLNPKCPGILISSNFCHVLRGCLNFIF